ncbi:adenosylcobinamide kinase [Magnetococcus marinus MC-1]|uniref:Bifunctional adenosylcobalamin biosynthesis protein n=1 Tax=Magnetococcus marinus (strain ATCC BAA-1437 / JCM 17883 / MC-1) TaxID=156889 RepID=A0LA82_MAGMM|nr:bifunctional adenosylcobinamide kinase/adenosylcobinamide-phosphate guanylyltransferase [Magnetococcus marinus]ABK44875.1 adenosylcobinamide kinase [Magnetococcus marinus MC-1]
MAIGLILGGARSGKTALAEQWAKQSGWPVVMIATARNEDAEMAQRIARHRALRPAHWQTVEEPVQLAAVLQQHAAAERFVVVDCLTLWLSNLLMLDEQGVALAREQQALLRVLAELPGQVVMVSNESGLGVVPMGALTRRYVDAAGALHQAVAARAERVVLTVAGLPLVLKG